MIYDKIRAARMMRVVLDVTEGALDLATRAGGDMALRLPAMEAEKTMRTFAAKGDVDAMYNEYLQLLKLGPTLGTSLERHHHKSFESEFYRLFKIYLEPGDRS